MPPRKCRRHSNRLGLLLLANCRYLLGSLARLDQSLCTLFFALLSLLSLCWILYHTLGGTDETISGSAYRVTLSTQTDKDTYLTSHGAIITLITIDNSDTGIGGW